MPRPQVLSFRLTSDEASRLLAAAQAAGLSPSAWCRRLVLDHLAAGGALPLPPAPPASAPSAPAAGAALEDSEPLSRVVAAKVTASTHFDLDARAKAAGLTIGAYLRQLLQGQAPTGRWPLARRAIFELSKVGTNLNQLVKLAHQGAPLPSPLLAAVEAVLAEVRAVRRALLDQEPQA